MSPFHPHTLDYAPHPPHTSSISSPFHSLAKRIPGPPSSPADPLGIGRNSSIGTGSTPEGGHHDAWLKARPFKHLGVWAYLALGVIILIALLVMAYMIYSCCHTARLKAREERAKAWWRMSGGNETVGGNETTGQGSGCRTRGGGEVGTGKGGGDGFEMCEMMAIGKAEGRSPFGRMRRASDIWTASTLGNDVGNITPTPDGDGNGGYKGFFMKGDDVHLDEKEWRESLVRKNPASPCHSLASRVSTSTGNISQRAAEKDNEQGEIDDALNYPPLAHTSERDSTGHPPYTPYYHLPTPIMRSGSRHSRPMGVVTEDKTDDRITEEHVDEVKRPFSRGRPPKKGVRRLTPEIPDFPQPPSTPTMSQPILHRASSDQTPPPSYHYVLDLPTTRSSFTR